MKDLLLNEITKELNWREKIIVHIFSGTFTKIFHITRIKTMNSLLK